MTIRTLARSRLLPEGTPPCHGLSDLFNGSRVSSDLLPELLACCDRCHMTRQCAQMALKIDGVATSTVTGVWGGVYVNAPSDRFGVHDGRTEALARLQAVADQRMAVA